MSRKIKNVRRKMATGGETLQNVGKATGPVGSGYYASQQPEFQGDEAYNAGMAGVSSAGPIGGVIGGISAIGDSIGKPIRRKAEAIDPETGGYKDLNKAVRGAGWGASLNPYKAFTSALNDPNATFGDKFAALSGFGGFTQKKLYTKRDEQMRSEKRKQDSLALTAASQGSYNNPYNQIFEHGGSVQSQGVELEKGEPFRLPNGDIEQISNNAPTHKQGGVPITLPNGTQILGNKKAMKGKEFKELGRSLKRSQDKFEKVLEERPTSLARKTAERNLQNIQKQYDALFMAQGEDVGNSKRFKTGGRVSNMSSKSKYPDGGQVGEMYKGDPRIKSYGYSPEQFRSATEGDVLSQRPYYNPDSNQLMGYKTLYKDTPGYHYIDINDQTDTSGKFKRGDKTYFSGTEVPEFEGGGLTGGSTQEDISKFQRFAGIKVDGLYGPQTEEAWGVLGNEYGGYSPSPMSGTIDNNSNYPSVDNFTPTIGNINAPQQDEVNGWSSGKWQNAAYTAGALAPVAYNLFKKKETADTLNAADYYNPYNDTIRSTMRGRRYNVNPELAQNRSNQATYNRQLQESGAGMNQLMAGYQAGSINKGRADSSALAMKQNMDNRYLGQQASMDANLGQNIAQTNLAVQNINDQNSAAARNINRAHTSAGLSQLSQFSQVKQLEKNQMVRDAQKLNLLPSLVQNFTYTDKGWIFNGDGQVKNNDWIMKYLKGTQ